MSNKNFPKKIKKLFSSFLSNRNKSEIDNNLICSPNHDISKDIINLNLWGLDIKMSRYTTIDVPAEVSVIVPRAEIRKKCSEKNPDQCDLEIILNSITIVHAPRHPLAEQKKEDNSPLIPQPSEPIQSNENTIKIINWSTKQDENNDN